MIPRKTVGAMLPPSAVFLAGLTLLMVLTSCTLGETMMPSAAPGFPADRSAGLVAPVPAPIPHSLDGRQECFTCHAIGAVDAPPVPSSHDQDVALCTTCHAVWLAPAIAAAAPPAIPHDLTGREDCLMCHKLGTANTPRVPDNHAGLPSAICQTCHAAQADIVGVSADATRPIVKAPLIPHTLEGFSACAQCHEEGGPGIPRFPDDHQGRTDDLCSACHSVAAEEAEATPATDAVAATDEPASLAIGSPVDGQLVFSANCAVCHGLDGEGSAIAPAALNDASLLGARTDRDLATTMLEGVTGRMPPSTNLSDRDIQDLVAYMRSWQ